LSFQYFIITIYNKKGLYFFPFGPNDQVQAFEEHHLVPGQRLLVVGCSGGVGHLAVQAASAMGAEVVGICSAKNAAAATGPGRCVHVVPYDRGSEGSEGWLAGLEEWCAEHGPFDLVLDTVTSHDARDLAWDCPGKIRGSTEPRLVAEPGSRVSRRVQSPATVAPSGSAQSTERSSSEEPAMKELEWTVDAHNYVTLGSGTSGWVAAGCKKVTGYNLFGSGRELFWITPQNSARHLEQLKNLCDNDGVRPTVAATVPLSSDGVASAFTAMHSRRTKGKYVIQVRNEEDEGASADVDSRGEGRQGSPKNGMEVRD